MSSRIIKEIKKLDDNSSVILDSLILNTYEVVPDSNAKHITIKNCTIREGLKIYGVSRGATLTIEDCTFESYNGIKIEKSSFRAVYIKNSVLVDTPYDEVRLNILSRIISQTVEVLDSYIHNLFISNINISIEVKNSVIESKLDYFPIERADDERSWAYFENVTFKSSQVRLAGAELDKITFKNININNDSKNKCYLLEIKQDYVLDLIFENANFSETYIDIENVTVRSITASSSNLGKCFNFFIGNIKEEQDRKVNVITIKNSHIDKSYFHGRIIHNSIDFSQTHFNTPPEFYNSELPHGSIFPNSEYFSLCGSDSSIAAFRALRLQMEEQRNRELEGEFFYLEQKSILKKENESGNRNWFRYFYGLISDFGNNAIKPLVILFATMMFFTLLYALIMSPEISVNLPIDYELLSKSMHFSTKQMTLPFWSVRNLTPLLDKEVQTHPIMYLAIAQSIVSLICIALSALAIRWRFKRG
ncbi:hypothetical protein [Thalassotalea castellviae]|uniref:Right-handed parallel beta-helix repeat-containing protein n=1 Tax=Thalassotalea castellviae TaxID=3075612 RepID=A0ABU3A3B6_9GAMM|nr:hypothetical protein [Thalassotalea sp. W431]MDT0604425.1 hypothetical protein [Thalassotalea sp. W431]